MKYFLLLLFILINIMISIAQTYTQEELYGKYININNEKDNILFIKKDHFDIYITKSDIKIDSGLITDIVIFYPDYFGELKINNDTIILIPDNIKNTRFLLKICDTLNIRFIENYDLKLQNNLFIRFEAFYYNNIDNVMKYRTKWTYNLVGNPDWTKLYNDTYFYYYDKNGEFIKKIQDTNRIHPSTILYKSDCQKSF